MYDGNKVFGSATMKVKSLLNDKSEGKEDWYTLFTEEEKVACKVKI